MDNSLLCELAAHPYFPQPMADLEIYVNGTAVKQVHSANALVDAARAAVTKRHNPGESDTHLRQLTAAPGADSDGAAMMFICKVLRLNYGKLTDDEKEWFKRIAEKSDLLKNPNPQRGRKRK